MSDLMKWPGARDKGKSNKPNNSRLKFVTDSHLEWLMDMIDRMRRGELLDAEDAECYTVIKEQAETFMAQAEAENWTQADKRARVLAWDDEYIRAKSPFLSGSGLCDSEGEPTIKKIKKIPRRNGTYTNVVGR